MIVKNKSKRCIRVGRVVLSPGSNLLEGSNVDDINKEIAFIERLIDNGVLEIPELIDTKVIDPEVDKPAEVIKKISELGVKDAVALVKSVYDKSSLSQMMDDEIDKTARPGVVKAIEKQIALIEDAQGKSNDNDE